MKETLQYWQELKKEAVKDLFNPKNDAIKLSRG